MTSRPVDIVLDEMLDAIDHIEEACRGKTNVLRHAYHRISSRIIWNVVTVELPKLAIALRRIQRRSRPEQASE